MPGFPVPFIKFREDDANGRPLAGGQLFSYAAGTSTPLPTYTTQAMTVPNTNPVILDASGRANVFIQDGIGYKFVLQDALGTVQWTADGIQVPQIAGPSGGGGGGGGGGGSTTAALPAGIIVAYGGTVPPPGWLLCDGASYSSTAYSKLSEALLGANFGGGGGQFNVPDLRQRFPLGKGASGKGSVMAEHDGQLDHVHTGGTHQHPVAAHTHGMKNHTHPVPFAGWSTQFNTPPLAGILQAGFTAGQASESVMTQANAKSATEGPNTVDTDLNTAGVTTGDGGAVASGPGNPPYLVVNYIISTGV
jgi:microcystin-dependent protein